MITAHRFINQLNEVQVFDLLRYVGSVAQQFRPAGLSQLPRFPVDLAGAPPSVDIARLLLHVAWEEKNAIQVTFHFYLNNHRKALMDGMTQAGLPDYAGWNRAAEWILLSMNKQIQIAYENGLWDIECSLELREVPEIRELITAIKITQQQIQGKNIIINSKIIAGRDVHIGDVNMGKEE